MKNISQAAIRRLQFVAPELPEQRAISEILLNADNRLKALGQSTTKLRVLKSGLMADLLTGRVRVTPLLETSTE
jgi:type I restriction enzyme S subunit